MSADCITKITEKVGCVAGKLQGRGQNCVTLCCPLGKCVKGITPWNVSENDCNRNDIPCCATAHSIQSSKTIYVYEVTITGTMPLPVNCQQKCEELILRRLLSAAMTPCIVIDP